MDPFFVDPNLTRPDELVLRRLLEAPNTTSLRLIQADGEKKRDSGIWTRSTTPSDDEGAGTPQHINGHNKSHHNGHSDASLLKTMNSWNNPTSDVFEPTIFVSWDVHKLPPWVQRVLSPYISWARSAARHQTDAVMVTHLLLYFSTSIPSAVYLYRNFTWTHGLLHWVMQSWYVGSYTLMRHQHIHSGGVLAKRFPYSLVDACYPYITDPLHGHTWNSYYYHHVKHHHVEGNGPEDLSSTIRYQRDNLSDFLCYLGRFLFFIWLDLPRYFLRKGRYTLAFKAWAWETSTLAAIVLLAYWRWRPTLFVLALPLLLTRVGLMIGNWGQHALVDEVEPDSDFRSSITLIDVASNRYCFNDGYHTSHHLNPLRHWREHPTHFLAQRHRYAAEHALVFANIDYMMLTVRLLMKDYEYLAKCLVPIGEQVNLTMGERAEMLRRKTRAFSEEEIRAKFGVKKD